MSTFPDGWFRDPENPGQLRYWDGSAWTGERMDVPAYAGHGAIDPPSSPTSSNLMRSGFPIAIGVIALVTVLVIVASGFGSGPDSDDESGTLTPPGVPSASAHPTSARPTTTEPPKTDAGKVVAIGDDIGLGNTDYRVMSAETKVVKPAESEESEDGSSAYVVVELEVVNRQPEARIFPVSAATLLGADGERYSSEGAAAIATGFKDSLLFNSLKPDEPSRGVLAFEVPPNAVDGARLEVSDLYGDAKATVKLGL